MLKKYVPRFSHSWSQTSRAVRSSVVRPEFVCRSCMIHPACVNIGRQLLRRVATAYGLASTDADKARKKRRYVARNVGGRAPSPEGGEKSASEIEEGITEGVEEDEGMLTSGLPIFSGLVEVPTICSRRGEDL